MKIYNHKLFPTLVKQYDEFLTEQQCKDIVNFIKNDGKIHEYKPHDAFRDGLGISSFHKTRNKDEDDDIYQIEKNVPSCNHLSVSLHDAIRQYTDDSGYAHCYLTQSWINIQKKGSSLNEHTHQFSQVSGILYLKCDEKSNKIYFYNPNKMLDASLLDPNRFTEYSYEWYNFQPKLGTLIIFPSWLRHGSFGEKNESEERIGLSFNTVTN